MWVIDLPLAVPVSANKWFFLNLNQYKNAHHRTLTKAKKAFVDRVAPTLKDVPKLDRILIAYSLFTIDNRRIDVANVCVIADKWFSDTLVEAGKLSDDNRKILPMIAFRDGGIDKSNPRVEATIHSIGPNCDISIVDG